MHLLHSKAWRSEDAFQELDLAFYLVGAGSLVSPAVVHTPVQLHSVHTLSCGRRAATTDAPQASRFLKNICCCLVGLFILFETVPLGLALPF